MLELLSPSACVRRRLLTVAAIVTQLVSQSALSNCTGVPAAGRAHADGTRIAAAQAGLDLGRVAGKVPANDLHPLHGRIATEDTGHVAPRSTTLISLFYLRER